MTSRSAFGSGWFDVREKGQVVGFVVNPSNRGGKWHAYLDHEGNAPSTRVGSYDSKGAAVFAVKNAVAS